MIIEHRGKRPIIHPTARIAPNAVVIAFNQFMGDPAFDALVAELAAGEVKERR